MKTHQHSASLCPHCDADLDTSTNVAGEGGPGVGDWTICAYCLSPLRFDGDEGELRLRALTDADTGEMDAETAAALRQARICLAIEKAKRGEPLPEGWRVIRRSLN